MATALAPVANPTINWSSRNLALEFKNYEEMCDLMFKGPLSNIADKDDAKFSYMLLWGGAKALELFRNSSKPTTRTTANLLSILKSHCQPSDQTFWSSRMEMRNISQRSGESFSDFVNRTCTVAAECGWQDKNEQVVCALIFGASHKDAQRTALLKSKDITIAQCLEHFTSYEVNDKQQSAIKCSGGHTNAVNVVSKSKGHPNSCWFCGTVHARRNCPAYGHVCKRCSKPHHFEHKCLSGSKGKGGGKTNQHKNQNKQYKQKQGHDNKHSHKKKNIYNVENDSDDEYYLEEIIQYTGDKVDHKSDEHFGDIFSTKCLDDLYGEPYYGSEHLSIRGGNTDEQFVSRKCVNNDNHPVGEVHLGGHYNDKVRQYNAEQDMQKLAIGVDEVRPISHDINNDEVRPISHNINNDEVHPICHTINYGNDKQLNGVNKQCGESNKHYDGAIIYDDKQLDGDDRQPDGDERQPDGDDTQPDLDEQPDDDRYLYNDIDSYCIDKGRYIYDKNLFSYGNDINYNNVDCNNVCNELYAPLPNTISAIFSVKNDSYDKSFVRLQFKDNAHVLCKIDTGADISVLPMRIYNRLMPTKPPNASSVCLKAYNGTQIPTVGEAQFIVSHGDVEKSIRFIVTSSNATAILSRPDALDLKCVKFLCKVSNHQYVDAMQSQTDVNIQHAKKKWKKLLPLGKSGNPKEEIEKRFPKLFSGVGQLQTPYRIQLKEDIQPVRHAQRRVPEAIKPKIKEELDRLTKEGIIKIVDVPTEWVNSLVCVSKPNGSIRLCLDPKDLNKAIKRPLHYSPTIDDVLPQLHGSEFFSVIDARSGYWNVPLENKSQLLTTFNTPGFGRFCFTRLPFGLISSQDVFQREMDRILGDLPNVSPVADDVKVHGTTELEHDIILLETLERCSKAGLNLNLEKCNIKKKSVTFFGNVLSTEGLQPDQSKIKAIVELSAPTNKLEVRSLIGMITFLGRFIPNVSALLEPLRVLIKKDSHFVWLPEHDTILAKVKAAVSSSDTLAYFDRTKRTVIQTDASLKGLGACLLQDDKPISFASKSLTKAESNYSNIEREMLGIVFALTRFHQYSYGRPIDVVSDHKPLEAICSKPLADAPPRLQRMMLRIQQYDYKIIYNPGSTIPIPDCLSRLVSTERHDPPISGMNINIHEVAITSSKTKLELIRAETAKDSSMCELRDYIITGWPTNRSEIPSSILPYWAFRDELGFYSGLIVKGTRICIPASLVADVLSEVHKGHMGIEKCKLRARQCVFWPSMNTDILNTVNKCEICQKNAMPHNSEYFLSIQKQSFYPMHFVAADIFEFEGNQYLLIVDYYSSYPWIRRLSSITTAKVINACRTIFSEFGYPANLHSDSGSQFLSQDFKSYMSEHNVNHTASSPYYHESNGKAERYVKTIKHLLKKNNQQTINEALLIYRSTPLSSTKQSPGEMMLNRKLNNNLVSIPIGHHKDATDDEKPEQPSRFHKYYPNDPVYVFDTHNKLWEKGRILHPTDQPNQYQLMLANGKIYVRNHIHIKPDKTVTAIIPQQPIDTNGPAPNDEIDSSLPDTQCSASNQPASQEVVPASTPMNNTEPEINNPPKHTQKKKQNNKHSVNPPVLRRTSRATTTWPGRFKDYVDK